MQFITKAIIFVALTLFSIVSIWTTYASLHDSILPRPEVVIPLPNGVQWHCSIFALGLSLAIGLMLFALKMAIIDDQKRLNFGGLIGMFVIASISIAFNMDVLYRVANQDFYITYSYNKMRSSYDDYLGQVQTKLTTKRDEILRSVAKQEGELQSEVEGLRKAPSGYGTRAKEEDYRLRLLQAESKVDLETIESALKAKAQTDELLSSASPKNIDAINDLQNQLRVSVKDAGVAAGIALPPPVEAQTPLFAVFSNLFNGKIGFMEIFFMAVAILLDLGDIVGYSLIPNKPKAREERPMPDLGAPAPGFVPPPTRRLAAREESDDLPELLEAPVATDEEADANDIAVPESRARRPLRFRRR